MNLSFLNTIWTADILDRQFITSSIIIILSLICILQSVYLWCIPSAKKIRKLRHDIICNKKTIDTLYEDLSQCEQELEDMNNELEVANKKINELVILNDKLEIQLNEKTEELIISNDKLEELNNDLTISNDKLEELNNELIILKEHDISEKLFTLLKVATNNDLNRIEKIYSSVLPHKRLKRMCAPSSFENENGDDDTKNDPDYQP